MSDKRVMRVYIGNSLTCGNYPSAIRLPISHSAAFLISHNKEHIAFDGLLRLKMLRFVPFVTHCTYFCNFCEGIALIFVRREYDQSVGQKGDESLRRELAHMRKLSINHKASYKPSAAFLISHNKEHIANFD